MIKNFTSDNNSGVHENIIKAMTEANKGYAQAYGQDELSKSTLDMICKKLGAKSAFFTMNGTGTNVCILDELTSKYGAVLCTDLCHVGVHEGTGIAKVAQIPLLQVPSEDGKLNPKLLDRYLEFKTNFHSANPEVISIAQTTEMGTVYSINEIKEIVSYAKTNGFKVHMDGSRISNACASLGIGLKELTCDLGIDALSFGMCKNGLMFGECAVFFNEEHSNFIRIVKSNLQLNSKNRFVAAQYNEILKDDLWLKNAQNANNMAIYMYESLKNIVKIVSKPESNMLFVEFPPNIIEDLQNFMHFYLEIPHKNYSRLAFNFDTTKDDVDKFVNKVKELI